MKLVRQNKVKPKQDKYEEEPYPFLTSVPANSDLNIVKKTKESSVGSFYGDNRSSAGSKNQRHKEYAL